MKKKEIAELKFLLERLHDWVEYKFPQKVPYKITGYVPCQSFLHPVDVPVKEPAQKKWSASSVEKYLKESKEYISVIEHQMRYILASDKEIT